MKINEIFVTTGHVFPFFFIYWKGDLMRRWRYFFLCFLFFCFVSVPLHAQSEAFCVMAQDGRVLYGEQLHQIQSVASISKVMTAIIAIEHGDLSQEVTIGDEIKQAQGSSVYLKSGECYTLLDLLYGLLLRSGNDAALSIAKAVGGSEEQFVQWMNEKALELGMNDTAFHNPSGLDEMDGGNQSTVYDMALLMNYAMNNEMFAQITSASSHINEKGIQWINKNKLLTQYPYAIGGKTGYTKQAGRTLVTCAKKEDVRIVIVTFRMSDDFQFHEQYYERSFEEYQNIPLLQEGAYILDGKQFVIEDAVGITTRRNTPYQVKESYDAKGYRLEANSEGHTVVYDYPWR